MTLNERIEALKVRGAGKTPRELTALIAADASLKNEIKEIYTTVFKKQLTGCMNCVADAFYEIIQSNTDNMIEKAKPRFWLRAGAVLHDKNFNADKMMSNVNITDELAIYHLSTNPDCIVYFNELPENWEQMLNEYEAKKQAQPNEPIRKARKTK